jgi:hypothetical protein
VSIEFANEAPGDAAKRAYAAKAPTGSPEVRRRFGGSHPAREGKVRLVRRQDIDQRTLVARDFDAQVAAIKADLGGDTNLSAVERQLVENFAGISTLLNDMLVQILLGQPVDPFVLCTLNSASVRVASRLGVRRRAKDVTTPHLADYLDAKSEESHDKLPDFYSGAVLELAATIDWLWRVERYADWQNEVTKRKGAKVRHGRLERAVELLRDLGLAPPATAVGSEPRLV